MGFGADLVQDLVREALCEWLICMTQWHKAVESNISLMRHNSPDCSILGRTMPV